MSGAKSEAPAPITTTLGRLADGFEVLVKLRSKELGYRTAAKINALIESTREHYIRFADARSAVAQRIGNKIAEDQFQIPPEKAAEFVKSMAPIRAEEVEFDGGSLLTEDNMAAVTITPLDLDAFAVFIKKT